MNRCHGARHCLPPDQADSMGTGADGEVPSGLASGQGSGGFRKSSAPKRIKRQPTAGTPAILDARHHGPNGSGSKPRHIPYILDELGPRRRTVLRGSGTPAGASADTRGQSSESRNDRRSGCRSAPLTPQNPLCQQILLNGLQQALLHLTDKTPHTGLGTVGRRQQVGAGPRKAEIQQQGNLI